MTAFASGLAIGLFVGGALGIVGAIFLITGSSSLNTLNEKDPE